MIINSYKYLPRDEREKIVQKVCRWMFVLGLAMSGALGLLVTRSAWMLSAIGMLGGITGYLNVRAESETQPYYYLIVMLPLQIGAAVIAGAEVFGEWHGGLDAMVMFLAGAIVVVAVMGIIRSGYEGEGNERVGN